MLKLDEKLLVAGVCYTLLLRVSKNKEVPLRYRMGLKRNAEKLKKSRMSEITDKQYEELLTKVLSIAYVSGEAEPETTDNLFKLFGNAATRKFYAKCRKEALKELDEAK